MTIETYGLSKQDHEFAVKIASENIRNIGEMRLKDAGMFIDTWLRDAEDEGNTEYADFLKEAINKGAEIYELHEDWQPLGEVIVY